MYRRRLVAALLVIFLPILLWLSVSVGRTLSAPGTDSVSARLAEWARNHHLGWFVVAGERLQYRLHPPKTGGTPPPIPSAGKGAAAQGASASWPHLPAPAPVTPFGQPPLPNEGRWRVLESVHGLPALRAADVRPDARHSSYLTGIAWLDTRLLRFALHPGTLDPGVGGWSATTSIPAAQRPGLVALFNSGFRMREARGGYYAEGRTVGVLRPGAASFVITRDGTATVGRWGRDVHMSGDVLGVRQNLDLIVDSGRAVPGLAVNDGGRWGATLGNALYVWRSAVGVTRTGAIVYAAGNALSAPSLAEVMVRAGAVRAMELDINPAWVTFAYLPAGPGTGTPATLTPDERRSPSRWFVAPSSRDFFAVYARP